MRKSRQEAAETRERIVEAAAAEFRQNGIGGTGLADLMSAAGLTHGGFYRHFQSKDQLVAEASASAIASLAEMIAAAVSHPGKRSVLVALAASYLTPAHRDNCSGGCPYAALASELVRADDDTRGVATEGIWKIIDLIAGRLSSADPDAAKQEALAAFSMLVGALTLSRMVIDPILSALLLGAAKEHLDKA